MTSRLATETYVCVTCGGGYFNERHWNEQNNQRHERGERVVIAGSNIGPAMQPMFCGTCNAYLPPSHGHFQAAPASNSEAKALVDRLTTSLKGQKGW